MMEIASSHCENSTKSEVFPFTAALPFQWIVPTDDQGDELTCNQLVMTNANANGYEMSTYII